ncbi:hypothetical protein JTE90_015976 [Oedothorax gibbosus]|uniref:MADF domain-containing protein n=1 Tax=Oedothorax gibbosus TaxID=931172 RepID=A0AAV6VTQ9_9ARAC|nr:hypothetical protein JTE90_015976 [Oedothorax gibbosus]
MTTWEKQPKKKWKGLKDSLRKNLNKLKTVSGQESRHVNPYKYTTIMSFVTPFLVNREQQSNLSSGESDEDVAVPDPVFGSPFVAQEVGGFFCLHPAS